MTVDDDVVTASGIEFYYIHKFLMTYKVVVNNEKDEKQPVLKDF